MKLKLKELQKGYLDSFYVVRMKEPCWDGNWHYHLEYELIYLIKGRGMRLVGDNISSFSSEELVLVGKWIPHLWRNGNKKEKLNNVDRIVVKFTDEFNTQQLFQIAELRGINELLKRASRGIKFGPNVVKSVHPHIISLTECEGYSKIVYLVQILGLLAEAKNFVYLTTPNYHFNASLTGDNRLNLAIKYISDNYYKDISLKEVAGIAALTPNSFCRFFKLRTNKSLVQFINEIRTEKACQLLINGEDSIIHICYDTGFNSLVSFNRVFKQITKQTPSGFRKKYAQFSLEKF